MGCWVDSRFQDFVYLSYLQVLRLQIEKCRVALCGVYADSLLWQLASPISLTLFSGYEFDNQQATLVF
jgi:hypothetical protein